MIRNHSKLWICIARVQKSAAWFSSCSQVGMGLSLCIADCWQQLLARSLHGAHIPPDYGFLQPVHLHEWPESVEWCPCTGDTTAGGWAAGGKITTVTHNCLVWKSFRICSWNVSSVWHKHHWKMVGRLTNILQCDYIIYAKLLANTSLFMLAVVLSLFF